jgi:hypothetical protein
MLLEITAVMAAAALLLRFSPRIFAYLRSARDQKAQKALASRLDWNRQSPRRGLRKSGRFWPFG